MELRLLKKKARRYKQLMLSSMVEYEQENYEYWKCQFIHVLKKIFIIQQTYNKKQINLNILYNYLINQI